MTVVDSPASVTAFRSAVRRLLTAPLALRSAYLAVFALSVMIRIVLAAGVNPVLVSDARDYHMLARNLAEGHGYTQVYHGETEAFEGFTFRAFRSPGYPVVLTALHTVFGWHPAVYLGLNIAADSLTQVLALLIAVYLFGPGAALVVQILLGLHVLWMPSPMTESLYTAMFTLLALLIVLDSPPRSWGGAVAFGLIAVATLFVRPITLCVFPVVGWRYLRPSLMRRSVLLFALAVLPSVLGTAAWAVRNHAVLGHYVLLTTNFGHHNAPDYGIDGDAAFARLRRQGLNEAEINRELTGLEGKIAFTDPAGWARLWARRAGRLFSLSPPWELQEVMWGVMLSTGENGSWIGRLHRASYAQYYVTYALFAGGAVVLIWRRQGLGGLWMLMLCYVALHAAVSRGDMRLLAPLYPLLCMLPGGLWAVFFARRRPHTAS